MIAEPACAAARPVRGRACGWGQALLFLLALMSSALLPSAAQARLQCVPYAREVSGIAIHGDAHLWWSRAEGRYRRGAEPRVGAVLAFRSTAAMPLGHVAVVSQILDDRRILLDHANWSGPGMIEHAVLAQDVSAAGDWSAVRVWYAPIAALGSRENPTYGFIYNQPPQEGGEPALPTGGQLVLTEQGSAAVPTGG